MRKREVFIPLSEANTPRISTVLNLPLGLSDEVGINTRLATALLQLGGFKHLRIAGSASGETSSVRPVVSGVGLDGSATAGRAEVKTVLTHEESIDGDDPRLPKLARWPDLTVELRTREMQDRILLRKESVLKPESWAREVDIALRQALVIAGINNLLGEITEQEKRIRMLFYMHVVSGTVSVNSYDNFILSLLTTASLYSFIYNMFFSIKYGREKLGAGRRLSLLPFGPHIDRAVFLGVLGNLSTLAAEVDKKPKS